MTGFWYVATVYSKWAYGLADAFEQAKAVEQALCRAGLRCYSPIAATHPIAMQTGIDPYDHSVWLPIDQPIMDRAYGLVVVEMPGWKESKGITHEIEAFRDAGKPIRHLRWPATPADVDRFGRAITAEMAEAAAA